jgi:hypothetical protein
MTKKELADKNIGMTFDFIKQLLEHPEIVDTIKDGAEAPMASQFSCLSKPVW